MTYSEELKAFRATHTYETKIVEGSTFHYVFMHSFRNLELRSRSLSERATEVWLHRFTHRCITARSEDWF